MTITTPTSLLDTRGHAIYALPKGSDHFTLSSSGVADRFFTFDLTTQCDMCGTYIGSSIIFNGDGTYRLSIEEECPFPQGIPDTQVILNWQSGQIVIADDLRFATGNIGDENIHLYNSAYGKSLMTKSYAQSNIAYGYVGNTDPSVYLESATGTIRVAEHLYNEDTDDLYTAPKGWTLLGRVWTDLWAFTMMDYDEFVSTGHNPDQHNLQVTTIPAGIYTMTYKSEPVLFENVLIHAELVHEASTA